MMNINDIRLFLILTESQSLAQAGRRLNMTSMAVSRRLAALEKAIGRRLIQRTTRALSLTQEGIDFIPYARTIVETEQSASALFSDRIQGGKGLLRVTAPSGLGTRYIMPLIPDLLSANPQMDIDVQLNEDIIDIVGCGIDVAIRVAPLRDSNLIARRIVDNSRLLCASPDYLLRYGRPQYLDNLSNHHCLRLSHVPQWTFIKEGQILNMTIRGRCSVNHVDGVRNLCLRGLGIAQLCYWDVRQELMEGRLQEIKLQDVSPQSLSIWALLPSVRFLPPRVTVFLEVLTSVFTGLQQ